MASLDGMALRLLVRLPSAQDIGAGSRDRMPGPLDPIQVDQSGVGGWKPCCAPAGQRGWIDRVL